MGVGRGGSGCGEVLCGAVEGGGVGGVSGEVVPFVGIGLVVVEFCALGAAIPFGIAVAFGADGSAVDAF